MELTNKELDICREAINFLCESITDDYTCKVMNENIKEELALISKIENKLTLINK